MPDDPAPTAPSGGTAPVGTEPGTELAPTPAAAPAEPVQPDGDFAAKYAALESELADRKAFDPLLGKLSAHPEAALRMLNDQFDFGDPAVAAAAVAASGSATVGGEEDDPRFAAMSREIAESKRLYHDLMLEMGLAKGRTQYGDEWKEKDILSYIAKHGVTDPEQAYFALRGQKVSPDTVKQMVAEGVKSELARLAGRSEPSPSGLAGPASGQPSADAPQEGLIGSKLREAIRADYANDGMAAPPVGAEETP